MLNAKNMIIEIAIDDSLNNGTIDSLSANQALNSLRANQILKGKNRETARLALSEKIKVLCASKPKSLAQEKALRIEIYHLSKLKKII